jgi:hypothetical protein
MFILPGAAVALSLATVAVSALSSTPQYHSCVPVIEALGLDLSDAEYYNQLLPNNTKCGSFDAPLDWSLPMSKSNFINLNFTVMLAPEEMHTRYGLLFGNPGKHARRSCKAVNSPEAFPSQPADHV